MPTEGLPPVVILAITIPMSRQSKSKRQAADENPLGNWLRELRHARGVPLRVVAAAAEMDTALVSKVELGQRLPTEKQTIALAAYFSVPLEEMEAKRLAEKFWIENKDNPAAGIAATLIKRKAREHGEEKSNP
jgi:transcriptional regulator with XRE-family HTH domain